MKIFDTPSGIYNYSFLPAFAEYIQQHHLDEFAEEQLKLSNELPVPLMQYLKHLTKEELLSLTKESLVELMGFLSRNEAKQQVATAVQKWLSNQLGLIHMLEVEVEDITLINYIRSASFKKFIPRYTDDLQTALKIIDEIDAYIMASTTSSLDTYIDILKENIAKKETQLLEAQSIASVGSFEFDVNTHKRIYTPQLNEIFENEIPLNIDEFLKKVHKSDAHKVKEAIENAFHTGEYNIEFRYCINNKIKYLWSTAKVINDNHNQRMIGTVQDITDRKKIEENLVSKTIELERSNEELQQFASVASHDLKEPLRKIAMFTDLVENNDENLSESSKNNLEKIKQASRRMGALIEDILSYSSLDHKLQAKKINLEELFSEVLELVESRRIEKDAVISSDGLPEALVVPFQFRQLFQNLISNSLKFTKAGVQPKITITHQFLGSDDVTDLDIKEAQKYLQIRFCDNGIGFSQEQAGKIFGLFSRLHAKSKYEGTGLGLAICRRVAENHKGVIYATGSKGEGACFTVVIPQ